MSAMSQGNLNRGNSSIAASDLPSRPVNRYEQPEVGERQDAVGAEIEQAGRAQAGGLVQERRRIRGRGRERRGVQTPGNGLKGRGELAERFDAEAGTVAGSPFAGDGQADLALASELGRVKGSDRRVKVKGEDCQGARLVRKMVSPWSLGRVDSHSPSLGTTVSRFSLATDHVLIAPSAPPVMHTSYTPPSTSSIW